MLGRLLAGIVYLASFLVGLVVMLFWNGMQALFRALSATRQGARAAIHGPAQSRDGGSPPPGAARFTRQDSAPPDGRPDAEALAFFTSTRSSEPGAQLSAERETLPEAPAHPRRTRRPRHEERWIGTLVAHGVGEFTDRASGRKYASYYVRLDTDAGDVITRRGVELEQAVRFAGVRQGDRIELLFLGREAVEVHENGQGARRYRNRWRINPIN